MKGTFASGRVNPNNPPGYRNSTPTHPYALARKESAAERQVERDARSPEQQLALLDKRRGNSAKERARLEAQIAAALPKEKPKKERQPKKKRGEGKK